MAITQRSEYVDTAIRDLRLNPAIDSIPAHLAPDIQLCYELRPNIQVKSVALTNATSILLLAATTEQDIFITAIGLNFVKDVTATTTNIYIGISQGGVVTPIIGHRTTTLTIERDSSFLFLGEVGLKIDRNTDIKAYSATNTSNFTATAILFYYTLNK